MSVVADGTRGITLGQLQKEGFQSAFGRHHHALDVRR